MSQGKYDFDSRIGRTGTGCEKWDDLKINFGREDLMPFWVADMDFRSAPEITEALRERAGFGVFGYPTEQTEKYRTAVANWERRRHGWDVSSDDVGLMPGVVTGISVALCELTAPGDGVVVQPPVYPPFFREIRHNGRRVVENPLRETDRGYVMDLEHLRSVLTPDVKAILLCGPHNPVARVWKHEELRDFGRVCAGRDIVIICDEIHQDIIYSDAKHIPLSLACPEPEVRVVTLVAPSKTFNIAGLRASAWIARDAEIHRRLRSAFRRFHLSGINMFGLVALEAAYNRGEPWLDALMEYLEKNRDMTEQFLASRLPGVKLKHPEGTYVFWLDFRDYGLTRKELTDALTNRARVAMTDGAPFGQGGEGFARLNIGCPRSQLEEGLERLADTFGKL
ncbi:MAG: PatB family C-S lyase [Synergistaceae bacterium]|jgi:cystathionine beta-lyase|nr:PatB family C-S lyase [Synergistaceae bacterium]